jgi:hypothetical protein
MLRAAGTANTPPAHFAGQLITAIPIMATRLAI